MGSSSSCTKETEGTKACDLIDFDARYYDFLAKYTHAQTIIVMIGVCSICVWYNRTKIPTFVSIICVCAIFASNLGRALAFMQAREYGVQRLDYATYYGEEWVKLSMPFRALACFLCTWAHWIFSAQYFRLALSVPIIFSGKKEMTKEVY